MQFSVIVPLYNKEKHVKRAVNSILQQTHQEFEVLVVNDGSTDNSEGEVKKIQDSRVKLYNKSNEGVSSARNYGIQNSIYEYIAFLDADDTWQPLFLEEISRLISQYPNGGAYATSYEFKGNNIIKKANINVELGSGDSGIVEYFKGSLKDPLISASSVVIKKTVFSKIGFFSTKLIRGEDLEMWCKISLKFPIVFINKTLATYYTDTDNKATSAESIYNKSIMSIAEEILIEQKRTRQMPPYFEEYMIKIILSKSRFLIKNNKGRKARKILWKYKHTKYSKKNWLKNYILSFRFIYIIYKKVK